MAKIITGIQPSGIIHIANYLAAMKPVIELSHDPKHQVMAFVANYHAMTSNTDAKLLYENTIDTTLNWLACGLNTDNCILYVQSDIPEVQEIAWFLHNICPMGLLERSTAYRDKVENGLTANSGLFNYPVLMAADILMTRSEVVPVGKDQSQHLEISRDLAQKANRIWKLDLKAPQAYIIEGLGTIPGLDGRKMSKSYHNTIPLFTDEKTLRKLVMSIQTDSREMNDPKDPETCNIFGIYKAIASPSEISSLHDQYLAGIPYGKAKEILFEKLLTTLSPIWQRKIELQKQPELLQKILKTGAERARKIILPTVIEIRKKVGMY